MSATSFGLPACGLHLIDSNPFGHVDVGPETRLNGW